MTPRNLAEFLEELTTAGQLVRVDAEVDPVLEIAEITRRVARSGGPAVLYSRVAGCRHGAVTNLWGTQERLCRSLGVESLDGLMEQLAATVEAGAGRGWFDLFRRSPSSPAEGKFRPKQVKIGACQQIAKLGSDVDLAELPALVSWPQETQRMLTGGMVLTQSADTDDRLAERRPAWVLAERRLGVWWPEYHPALAQLAEHQRRGETFPVAVAFGGSPAWTLAAEFPQLGPEDPWVWAGMLAGRSLEAVPARSQRLEVPAAAELVIEGYIDPREAPVELGPVAIPGGACTLPVQGRLVHVTAMTHSSSPILPAVVHDTHSPEHAVLTAARERLLWPAVKAALPELVDFHLPPLSAGTPYIYVSIRKTHPQQARKAAAALWGVETLAGARFVVVLDEQVDVRDAAQVWRRVAQCADPARDVFSHAGPAERLPWPVLPRNGSLGIDATAKLPQECGGAWPADSRESVETAQRVAHRWAEYGLGPPAEPQ